MQLLLSFKILLFLLILTVLTKTCFATSELDLAEFDDDIIHIEKLIDNNTQKAYVKLKLYENRLAELSIKQQIIYYNFLTDIHIFHAQYYLAKNSANLGLSLTQKLTSPSTLISELLYSRGFALESLGSYTLARQDYESGLETAKSFNDNVLIATGLVNIGAVYYLTDQYEKSLRVLHDANNIAKQTTDEELKGSVNSELGILYSYLDSAEQSMIYYQQSYQHYKNAEKQILALNALVNIAINHLNDKRYEQATNIYEKIKTESQGIEQSEIMYSVYSGLSWTHLNKEQPDLEASYQYLQMAKKYIGSIERKGIELEFTKDEAFVLFELGRLDEALKSISKVEKILAKEGSLGRHKLRTKIDILDVKSQVYFKLGQFKQAYELQNEIFALTKLKLTKEHTRSVVEVRLTLEAQRADLHKKILENKYSLQNLALKEASTKQKQQRVYIISIAIIALLFAWLLVKLIQGQRRLDRASSIDMLTGIANRRSIMKDGHKLFTQATNKGTSLSVLMIDVDNFKIINDKLGHSVGDKVLKSIAKIGEQLMRKTDAYGRFGGEEFIAFLPNTSLEQARNIAERYKESIMEPEWQSDLFFEPKILVSVSIGIACTMDIKEENKSDLESVINVADIHLYQAKSSGRNRVCG